MKSNIEKYNLVLKEFKFKLRLLKNKNFMSKLCFDVFLKKRNLYVTWDFCFFLKILGEFEIE